MTIVAKIQNEKGINEIHLSTNGKPSTIQIPSKNSGFGSSINGGELLFLALATCYVNDIYREAGKRNIVVSGVEVQVSGEFGPEGESAQGIAYNATVTSTASKESIAQLMQETDRVAEIHNTLRHGAAVTLVNANAISVKDLP
jgi:uncharacterized OsmC-like protein